jgi:RHS repeat-associated protein
LRTDTKNILTNISYARNNLALSVTANGKQLNYLYDVSDDRIYNQNSSDNETQFYLFDLSGKNIGVNGINGWEWNAYGHEHIATIQSTGTQYYEYDHLGGVRTTYSILSLNCPGINPAPSYSFNYIADYYAFGKILRSYLPSSSGLDRYGYQGSEHEKRISDNNYYTHFRELDSEIGRWWSIDPKFKVYESSYASMGNNPGNLTDKLGNVPSTDVKDEGDGKYKVVGGNQNDGDKKIYVVDDKGKRTGKVIGESLTPESFYFSEQKEWHGTINKYDFSGVNFLNLSIIAKKPSLTSYMFNATGGKKYDFKRTGHTAKSDPLYNNPEYHYRGMPFSAVKNFPARESGLTIYASARDVGNFAAGWISSGVAGMGYELARSGFNTLESLQNLWPTSEGSSTQYAEKAGWEEGVKEYLKTKQQK